jgi:phosphopantetheine--protein transferase-like protein
VLHRLLGGLVMEARLVAFLSRMLGEPVDAQARIVLSSTQRARLVAWLNDNGHPTDFARFKSNLTSVGEILDKTGDAIPGSAAPAAAAQPRAAAPVRAMPVRSAAPALAPLGLGIDLQALANLPETSDYRADSFYARNFTDSELAHAIQQGDPRQSLCGIWAAKEAVVKAGAAAPSPAGEYRGVEIGRDANGAPTFPGCLVSITHEAGLAAAVCVRLS